MGGYIVYVLRSVKDGRRYIGMTTDLDRRLKEHNRGQTTSTRNGRPFVLVYYEECKDRQSSREREKYFKTAAGTRYLKKVIPSS